MMEVPELGGLQNYILLPLRMMSRFGMWDEILVEPVPDTDQDFVAGFSHYTRGMALLRTGRAAEATAELEMLRARVESPGIQPYAIWWNPASQILTLGALALEAELLHAAGEQERTVALLERAVALEDGLSYDEPPPWSIPSRQVLGRIHFERGRGGGDGHVPIRARLEHGGRGAGGRDALSPGAAACQCAVNAHALCQSPPRPVP